MQTNSPSLTAVQITEKILNCKGNFVKVFWKSNPTPAAIHKKAGVVLEKVTNAVVRAGIDFANLSSVKEGIENGERGEVQSLPWGEWKQFPYVITHKEKEYIRLYPSAANTPKVKYFVNGGEVDKITFASYLTPSEANKLLNPEEKPIECFTVSADNILGTEDYNELVSLQNDWVKVNDEDILHVWVNDETGEEETVNPDFYETNGEPCDEDGNVLRYSHTIIRK